MARWKNLEIERIEHPDAKAVVFRLAGKLVGTKECYEFLEMVRDDVHVGNFHIILNLENIGRVSSPGIGIIAASYTSVTNAGGTLSVVGVPKPVRTLLELVCLWGMLVEHESETAGVAAATQVQADNKNR